MKRLTRIFQALMGVVVLVFTSLAALGRLAWRTVKGWWQKRSKPAKYSLAAFAILIVAGFAAWAAYDVYNDKYGRNYYDYTLSQDIQLHSFADSKCRMYDSRTGKYTTPKIDWLKWDEEGEDSLAVYALSNRRGYININTGRITIDAKANDYEEAWIFSEGVAAVMKEDKIGFINAKNKVVIPFQYDYSDDGLLYNFDYIFHDGYCAMANAEGELGLIDKTGAWIVEPAYDAIHELHENGYRTVVDDELYGVLDAVGSIVYPAEYQYIDILPNGFVLTKAGRRWQVDSNGQTVQPFMFDGMNYLNYPTGYDDCGELTWGLSDYATYVLSNRYGIINRHTGRPLTPAIYSNIEMLSAGLFKVQEYDSYEWYLLDTDGNVVDSE